MAHAFAQYRDTPLWRVLADALAELEATREISVATGADYVVGYLCQQLVAGRITGPTALAYEP